MMNIFFDDERFINCRLESFIVIIMFNNDDNIVIVNILLCVWLLQYSGILEYIFKVLNLKFQIVILLMINI